VRDSDFRLQAIHATINAAGGSRSLILVDEADEVLNTERPIYVRSAVDVDKSWLTNLLDNHQRKIIWVTNASRGISPSVMRRFSFSLHFDRLTPKNRATVFKHELAKRDLMNLFDDDDVRDLSNRYAVDAGGIVNAVNIMQLQTRSPKERVRESVEAVLKNHQFATLGIRNNLRPRDVQKYSIEGLNTSPDLNAIIAALRDFAKGSLGSEVRSVSVMLHGPPGTGKTEFVHYLAGRLEKELVIKRVSDIEDKYVGETEKNIAQAFHEAQADNSILFFDEADSFFYPRKDATASWEKKFTNELLAQLDDFQGIVIFSTNDIDGLDHAALRRFKFKVRFSTLEPRGIRHFYGLMLGSLAAHDKGMKLEDLIRLEAMKGLTPGDFAVVRDQFLFVREEERTHRAMIAALETEVEHKREKRKVTGFGG
jgi:SpoVK/Ycf46/Vps4 family AAA+-type ATPase